MIKLKANVSKAIEMYIEHRKTIDGLLVNLIKGKRKHKYRIRYDKGKITIETEYIQKF